MALTKICALSNIRLLLSPRVSTPINAACASSNSVSLIAFQIPYTSSGGSGIYTVSPPHQQKNDGETNHIRIRPHKRKRRRPGRPINMINATRHNQHRVRNQQLPPRLPPQHRAPRKMAAGLNRHQIRFLRATRQQRQPAPFPEYLPRSARVRWRRLPPHGPLRILAGEVHRAAERLRPVQVCGEVVRVRDDNCVDPA